MIIRIGPDLSAEGLEAVRFAFGKRRVGEQRGGQRLQGERDAQLAGHVGLAGVIEVDLHGTRAGHHIQPVLPDQRHVAAHDGVAAFGHPVHGVAAMQRLKPERGEPEAERVGHAAHFGEMRQQLGARTVQV